MCGIACIIDQSGKSISFEELADMTRVVSHRGPDDEGFHIDGNMGLGHRRLAIIDLSNKAKQPLHYLEKYCLIFNGQIYNYIELKSELIVSGYKFKTRTDAEVILAAYDHWGMECFDKFNGMWSFVLYDKFEHKLVCSRDRFGIKPFYFTQIGSKFCIASEIKQFTKVKGWKAMLNHTRAIEFLSDGFHDHTAETLFKDVFQLPQGNCLLYSLDDHQYEISTFYDLRIRKKSLIGKVENFVSKFLPTLKKSILFRSRSDVKIGTSLSGGLDSSAITVLLNSLNHDAEKLSSFSAVFPTEKEDESKFITAIVEKIGCDSHKVLIDDQSVFESLDLLIWHQDEPFASTSVFPQSKVFEKAAIEGVKVLLEGQGADEILCGYEKFYIPFIKELLLSSPLSAMREISFLLRKYSGAYWNVLKKVTANSLRKRNPSLNWLVNMDNSLTMAPGFNKIQATDIKEMTIAAIYGQGLPIFLHYADRSGMQHSVESRVPFLDHHLVELCLDLPNNSKIKNGVQKQILREELAHLLPKMISERKDKNPYSTPDEKWMNNNLDFFKGELIKAHEEYGDLFLKPVVKLTDKILIWRVVLFYRWLKLFEVRL